MSARHAEQRLVRTRGAGLTPRVRTDESLAVQHAGKRAEGLGRCLNISRILSHIKVDVVIYQGLEMVQATLCTTSDAFKSDI